MVADSSATMGRAKMPTSIICATTADMRTGMHRDRDLFAPRESARDRVPIPRAASPLAAPVLVATALPALAGRIAAAERPAEIISLFNSIDSLKYAVTADELVPMSWSVTTCEHLNLLGKNVECLLSPGRRWR